MTKTIMTKFTNVVNPQRGKDCATYGRAKLGSALYRICLRQGAPKEKLSYLLELEHRGFAYLIQQEVLDVIDYFMPSFINEKKNSKVKHFLFPIFPSLRILQTEVLNARLGGLVVGDGTLEAASNSNLVRIKFSGHIKDVPGYLLLKDLLGSLFYFSCPLKDKEKNLHVDFMKLTLLQNQDSFNKNEQTFHLKNEVKYGHKSENKPTFSLNVNISRIERVSFLLSRIRNHLLGKDFRLKFNVCLKKIKANKKQGGISYTDFFHLKPLDKLLTAAYATKAISKAFSGGFADADGSFGFKLNGTKNKATGLKSFVRVTPLIGFDQKERDLLMLWGEGFKLRKRFEKSAYRSGSGWKVSVENNHDVALLVDYFRENPPILKLVDIILWQIISQLKTDKAHLTKTGLASMIHLRTWLRKIRLDEATFKQNVAVERKNNAELLRCKEFTYEEIEAMYTPDLKNFKKVFPPLT